MSRMNGKVLLIACSAAVWLPILSVLGQEASPTVGNRAVTPGVEPQAIDQGVDPRWRNPGESKTLRDQVSDYTIVTPRPGRDLPYEPGRLVVKFRTGASASGRVAALAAVGAASTSRPEYADFEILNIATDVDPVAAARELSERPDVEYAQADYRVKPLYTPNDPLFSQQWNLAALDMQRAWDINPGASSDIVVAVIDTGVAWRTQALTFTTVPVRLPSGQITRLQVNVPFAAAPELTGASRWVAPRDFNWNDTNPSDQDGHGTHVAGSVGQLTNNGVGVAGMAFNVRIMPLKVLTGDIERDFFNPPFPPTESLVAQAIRYAADNGANVVNLSLGSGAPPNAIMESALRYAVDRGVFVVIAAGNEFVEGNPVSSPARYGPGIDGVITVGSVGRGLRRAYYSNTGSYVEIAAPGGDLRANGAAGGILQQTYLPDAAGAFPPRFDLFVYAPFQGTSMAAPHVAGFAALLMQQGIRNPAAIEAAMKRFARDIGATGRDNEFGYGLIDPPATLRGLGYVR